MSLGVPTFRRIPEDVRDGTGTKARYENGVLRIDVDFSAIPPGTAASTGLQILAYDPVTNTATLVPLAQLLQAAGGLEF